MEGGKDVNMNLKIIGAVLVVVSCGGFGFSIAANHRRSERSLRQLIAALDYMECELQYNLTPLPELCRQTSKEADGIIKTVFLSLAVELESQVSPDVGKCMESSLKSCRDIPRTTEECLQMLGQTLGRFDLQGQLRGLETVRVWCRQRLGEMEANRDVRLRSYQTLGLCAGAALAILLI